ncbi:DUF1129 family protein [Ureibacillus aquaedulcis]|uniref:DUF1129 family protein n=1 Tax=Ureibacillus aquaedulcis TaxID=3058421 RepID=A0ABT8GR66_9BACL|nr:DUF1129 family protein [Ureibacillus sp. BA0131]MDN4493893.1 DUF1129 family protein [Ureibacillus sp. BA0131]
MQMTVKEIIKQNNEKRESLTPENKEYYENMLVYIRTNPMASERATEEVLLEMLDHLLEAQSEGKSAVDVFGKTPKELAEEIIKTLPKESFKDMRDFVLEMLFTLFGWYLAIGGLFPLIAKQNQTVHSGSLLLTGILLISSVVVLLYFLFGVIKRNAFEDKRKKNKVGWFLGILFILLFVSGVGVHFIVEPFGPTFTVSYPLQFGLGCFFLLAAFLYKKSRESK